MNIQKLKEAINKRFGEDILVQREILDFLIEQAEKTERYEEALNKITSRKMSVYLSTSHMNQDFIKIANEALSNEQTGSYLKEEWFLD